MRLYITPINGKSQNPWASYVYFYNAHENEFITIKMKSIHPYTMYNELSAPLVHLALSLGIDTIPALVLPNHNVIHGYHLLQY